jgi:IS30 family transposase
MHLPRNSKERLTGKSSIHPILNFPPSRWGSSGNSNKEYLLRWYFPKEMNPADVSLAKLNAVARRLNERPGKTSTFETPAERFNACVAATS